MTRSEMKLDTRSLRALAHPLRVQMLRLLRQRGPATASRLAELTGESSGTTSWHLRQLAEHGFIEQDTERGNRRERWWRAAHETTSLHDEHLLNDPELAGSLNVYLQAVLATQFAASTQFVAEMPIWPDQWRAGADLSDTTMPLSPAELRELNEKVWEVVQSYRRPARAGDETVVLQWHAFPRRTEGES